MSRVSSVSKVTCYRLDNQDSTAAGAMLGFFKTTSWPDLRPLDLKFNGYRELYHEGKAARN
jgi:hypothetical protein